MDMEQGSVSAIQAPATATAQEPVQAEKAADAVAPAAQGLATTAGLLAVPTPARGARRGGRNGGASAAASPTSSAQEASAAETAPSGEGRGGRDKVRGPASALEDLMRRKGVDEAWNALEEMQRRGSTTDKYTVSRMLMKTVGDGRDRLNPSRVYRGITLVERFISMQPKDVDEVLFNALLDTCCRLKDLNRLEATVNRMRELKVNPSPVTLGILVKTYGQAGDLQKVLQVWSEMEKQRVQANAVTYGCMIDACVKCGHLGKAVEIFKGMRKVGNHKNTILYTTLIKGHGLEKDLASALELFREMPQEGVPYNTITYNSILDACVKCGDLATAESLLREMTAPESACEPDLITFSTLLKGYCHVGQLDRALQVAETIKMRGLRCDELVYNTLMDGCVKANDISAGVGLFEEMVQNGMRPSNITNSILLRLYQRAGCDEDAQAAVANLYQHHGIERPTGGDGSKGAGRRGGGGSWRSPHGAGGRGGRSGVPSPWSSPAHSVTSGGSGGFGGFGDGSCSLGAIPAMPGFDAFSVLDGSAPSTPLSCSPHGSPLNRGCQPYLPMEALRGATVPPMPGSGCGSDTPFSLASCTPAGSPGGGVPPASLPGSLAGSPYGGSSLDTQQHGFGIPPASPQAFGPQGCQPLGAGQLPAWPFSYATGGPQQQSQILGQEAFAVSVMNQGNGAMPATTGGSPLNCSTPTGGMMQPNTFNVPMTACSTDLAGVCPQQGQQQAYFETWGPTACGGGPSHAQQGQQQLVHMQPQQQAQLQQQQQQQCGVTSTQSGFACQGGFYNF